jgi:predicted DNA-binding protein
MHVTPSETSYRLLQELSALTGTGAATLVRELLDEANPALEAAVHAIRDVQKRPEQVQAAMARLATTAIRDLTQAQLDLDTAMEKRPGRKPGKGKDEFPRPLTPEELERIRKGREAANTG